MSDRVMCAQILDKLPDFKIGYVLAYLQGLYADEEADDAFCETLYNEYEADQSPDKHDTVTLEKLAEELGIIL